MDPLPQFDQDPTKDKHHEPLWPWETEPENTAKKPDPKEPTPDKKEQKVAKEPTLKESRPKNNLEIEEKRENHANLVEQAIALITQHEEAPIPHDPSSLARIMLAHQTIYLYEQLQHPEQLPEDTSVESIQATLDHIAQLDAKLQDPSLDVSPEIDASYQEVIHLAQTALEEESDANAIVADLYQPRAVASATSHEHPIAAPLQQSSDPYQRPLQKNTTTPTPTVDLTVEEFERRAVAARETLPAAATVALISYITYLGRQKKKHIPKYEGSLGSENTSIHMQPDTHPNTTPLYNASLQPPRRKSSPYASSLRPERPITIASRELPSTPQPSRLATAAVATALIGGSIRRTHNERGHTPSTPHVPQEIAPSPEPQHIEQSSPSRKIEHMSLLELLTMAETLPLGHGRYLRREFEAGAIDREGLVKILKAESKGQDFHEAFRQQARRFATLKATSPEFLHTSSSTQPYDETTDLNPVENKPENFQAVPPTLHQPPSAQPLSLAPPKTNQLLLPKFARSLQSKPQTTKQLLITTGILIGGLIVVGLLAGTILMLLG